MKERILEFLRRENKTSSQFAEEIGVQPSGISHIISGRNNPSLDFVLKMLEKYQYLSTEWLLFGKGMMYKDPHYGTLFDIPEESGTPSGGRDNIVPPVKSISGTELSVPQKTDGLISGEEIERTVKRIVWFFDDGTFEEFYRTK